MKKAATQKTCSSFLSLSGKNHKKLFTYNVDLLWIIVDNLLIMWINLDGTIIRSIFIK